MLGFYLKKALGMALMPIPLVLVALCVGLFLLRRRPRAGKGVIAGATLFLLLTSWQPVADSLLAPFEDDYPPFDVRRPVDVVVVLAAVAGASALDELVQEGLVRHLGHSNFDAAQMREADAVGKEHAVLVIGARERPALAVREPLPRPDGRILLVSFPGPEDHAAHASPVVAATRSRARMAARRCSWHAATAAVTSSAICPSRSSPALAAARTSR